MVKSLDGVLTKKANIRESFTEDQIADLKACADPDSGYLHFCKNFFNIQHPVEGKNLLIIKKVYWKVTTIIGLM
jgi:hypothetical protein